MVYTSTENDKIKEIKKLRTSKKRNLTNLFLVEGEHLVLEAFKAGYIEELIVLENHDFKLDVPTIYIANNVLKYISQLDTPQPVLAICKKKENTENLGEHIVMLDGVQDPGNLGTIIRSALAFNIDSVILSPNTVDLYNSKVIRASQGMLFHINVFSDDLTVVIKKLKANGYKIYGTNVTGGKSAKKVVKNDKFVIIMGNEGKGVSDEILNLCDEFIYIEINPACESLNVGAAASIILYELNK